MARPEITLLGIRIDNVSMTMAVEQLLAASRGSAPVRAAFVNADCVNIARRRPDYRDALRRADLVFADGSGLRLAGRWVGQPVRDNVNGTDLFPELCDKLDGTSIRLFLYGAGPGVAEGVAAWVHTHFPRVIITGTLDGFTLEPAEAAATIGAAGADIVLVALGAPRQDLWLRDHLAATGASLGVGVGGLFDFYSGRIPRAPRWLRALGLEWTYRLWCEPRRMWRRYLLGNVTFLWSVWTGQTV